MNYLAHFYLSDRSPEGFVGSILGDFVKGNLNNNFSKIITYEIEMHRKIDSFTDRHPIVKISKRRVAESRRKLSGVLIDVFYDHYLANNWHQYSGISLEEFSAEVYEALLGSRDILPTPLRERVAGIAEYDLLGSYKSIEGIGLALFRISKRLKRENSLAEGIFDIKNNYQALAKDFEEFFPELIAFVKEERAKK